MLRYHDYLKENRDFQASTAKTRHELPPLSTWLVFTDGVPHAGASGAVRAGADVHHSSRGALLHRRRQSACWRRSVAVAVELTDWKLNPRGGCSPRSLRLLSNYACSTECDCGAGRRCGSEPGGRAAAPAPGDAAAARRGARTRRSRQLGAVLARGKRRRWALGRPAQAGAEPAARIVAGRGANRRWCSRSAAADAAGSGGRSGRRRRSDSPRPESWARTIRSGVQSAEGETAEARPCGRDLEAPRSRDA